MICHFDWGNRMSEQIDYFSIVTQPDDKNKSFVESQNDLNYHSDESTKKDELSSMVDNTTDMPTIAKKTLVYLMRQGVILQTQKPQVFANVLQYQEMIIRHLSEVYLSLIIDERQGIIFIARADYQENPTENHEIDNEMSDEDDISSLINRKTISVYDSLLLLLLRKYYQERENVGEQQIIIDIEKLEGLLSPFLPLTNYETKGRKQLIGRINGLLKPHKIVQSIRNSDERFEITPMIRYVVNADFLQSMLNEYEQLLQKNQESTSDLKQVEEKKKQPEKPSKAVNNVQTDLF